MDTATNSGYYGRWNKGMDMTYNQLREYFLMYRAGMMSRAELVAAICLWQRSLTPT